MIVDDEIIVSRGLSEKVKWSQLNCTVCAIGTNGIEGQKLINQHRPDIVITDIKMPGMDGLDLAEYLKRNYPNTITILLSGYSEFNYAQTAVRHQVFDYLLKPVRIEDLKTCIKKAIEKIEQSSTVQPNSYKENNKVKDEFVESRFLLDIMINSNKDIGVSKKRIREFGMSLSSGLIIVFELNETSDYDHDNVASLYQFAVNNIVKETFQKNNINTTLVNYRGKSIAVVKFEEHTQLSHAQKRVLNVIKICQENIFFYLKKRANVGIGKKFKGIEQLSISFQSALNVLENNLFWGTNVHELQNQQSSTQDLMINNQIDPQFYESIRDGDFIEAKGYLDKFLFNAKVYKHKGQTINYFLDLLIDMLNIVSDGKVKNQVTKAITEITELRTFNESVEMLIRMIKIICEEIQQKRIEEKGNLLERVLNYIDKHYHNANLNLQYISEVFQVSSSHLSRVFKKEMSINFSEYLILKRVEKGKKLLENEKNVPVRKIAEQVGFLDSKYFGQVFKKHYGLTPSDFRDKELKYFKKGQNFNRVINSTFAP